MTIGTLVTHKFNESLKDGEIIDSDEWYDTLRIRGVGAAQQVLVAWESSRDDGAPIPLWCKLTDLEPQT